MLNLAKTQFASIARYEYIAAKSHTTAPIVAGGGNTNITIPHNLGYVPFARLFLVLPGDSNVYPILPNPQIAYDAYQIVNYYLDSTNVYLTLSSPSSATAGNYTVYYRIYAEPQA